MNSTTKMQSKLKKFNAIKLEDGLYYTHNYDFCKPYKGNRLVMNLSDLSLIHSKPELKEAKMKFRSIKQMLALYAKEYNQKYNTDFEYMFDINIPIILAYINNEFIIVDGQNRLAVCKELEIPYYFRILKDIDNENDLMSYIKRFNFIKTNWTKNQQVGSEARLGNIFAKTLIQFEEQYKVPLTNILYFLGKDKHKTKINFSVQPFDIDYLEYCLQTIDGVANLVTNFNQIEALKLKKHNRFTNFIAACIEYKKVPQLLAIAKHKRLVKIKGATSIEAYSQVFGMFDIREQKEK